MISFKNFHLSEKFIRIDSIMYQSGKDLNLEKWTDPYDSDLLKFVTVLIYFVNVLASIVMVAFVVYETRGTQLDLILFFFKSLLTCPQGSQGCQKIYQNILHIKLLSSCAKIEPKFSKLGRTIKIEKRIVKNPFFLTDFKFNSILAPCLWSKTSKYCYRGFVWIFCCPRDSRGRVHSEEIIVLCLLLIFLSPYNVFSNNSKNKVWSHLFWFQA